MLQPDAILRKIPFTNTNTKITPKDREDLEKIRDAAGISTINFSEYYSERKWLKDSILEWASDIDPSKKIFWLMGGPGIGKSSLIKKIIIQCRQDLIPQDHTHIPPLIIRSGQRECSKEQFCIAYHFFKADDESASDPKRAILDIFLQLQLMENTTEYLVPGQFTTASIEHDFFTGSMSPLDLFTKYIFNPLTKRFSGFEIILFLDAIDEILDENENTVFIQEIINNIQSSENRAIRLLITSRNPPEYYDTQNKITPFSFHSTDPRCLNDVQGFLRDNLKDTLVADTINDYIIKKIWLKSSGNFLYLYYLCYLIKNDQTFTISESEYPVGLKNMYIRIFESLFGERKKDNRQDYYAKCVEPYISVLCIARHPLGYQDFFEKIVREHKRKQLVDEAKNTDINRLISGRIAHVFSKDYHENTDGATRVFSDSKDRIDFHLSVIKAERNRYKAIHERIQSILADPQGKADGLMELYITWEIEVLKQKLNPIFPKSPDNTIRPKHRSVVEWLLRTQNSG